MPAVVTVIDKANEHAGCAVGARIARGACWLRLVGSRGAQRAAGTPCGARGAFAAGGTSGRRQQARLAAEGPGRARFTVQRRLHRHVAVVRSCWAWVALRQNERRRAGAAEAAAHGADVTWKVRLAANGAAHVQLVGRACGVVPGADFCRIARPSAFAARRPQRIIRVVGAYVSPAGAHLSHVARTNRRSAYMADGLGPAAGRSCCRLHDQQQHHRVN